MAADLEFQTELYCLLCRRSLVLYDHYSQHTPEWEDRFIAFFRVETTQGSDARVHIVQTDACDAEEQLIFDPRQLVARWYDSVTWKRLRGAHRQSPVFFVHRYCWQAARKLVGQQGQTAAAAGARGSSSSVLSFRRLYVFGQQTQPVLPPAYNQGEHAAALSRWPLLPLPRTTGGGPDAETSLGRLLRGVAQALPLELQLRVTGYLGVGHVASLLRALETVSTVLPAALAGLPDPPSLTRALSAQTLLRVGPLDSKTTTAATQRGRLVANICPLFGHAYLRDLAFVPDSKADADTDTDEWSLSVPVRGDCAVVRAKACVGPHGVQVFSLGYDDGSWTRPLGRPGPPGTDRYFQAWQFDDHPWTLQAISDGMKVLRIKQAANSYDWDNWGAGAWPSQALWSMDIRLPAAQDRLSIIDTERQPFWELANYPVRRLCQFLPLRLGDASATGLTVYCDLGLICGLVAHFGRDAEGQPTEHCRIGWQHGCPVHFSLGPDECIDYAGACFQTIRSHDLGPSLVIGTNLGRAMYFGRYEHVAAGSWGKTVSFARERLRVTGFFTDLLTSRGDSLTSIGVAMDRPAETPPSSSRPQTISLAPRLPRIVLPGPETRRTLSRPVRHSGTLHAHAMEAGTLTWASLGSVRRLRARRVDDHYVGLAIYYRDSGQFATVGSWDPSEPSGGQEKDATVSDLFNAADGRPPPFAITLRMARAIFEDDDVLLGTLMTGAYRVKDIVLGIPDNDNDNDDEAEGYDLVVPLAPNGTEPQHLLWWCTQHYDNVQLSEALEHEPIVSSYRYRDQYEPKDVCWLESGDARG